MASFGRMCPLNMTKQRSFMVYSDLYCFWITTVRINNVIYTISTCSRKLQTPPYLLENPSDGDVL